MVIKRLSRIGNNYGFTIDEAYLNLLNADLDTGFEMSVSDGSIIFTPVSNSNCANSLEQASARFNQKYEKTLRKLSE